MLFAAFVDASPCTYNLSEYWIDFIQFSVVELLNDLKSCSQSLFSDFSSLQLEDVEEALLYLSKIGAMGANFSAGILAKNAAF